MFIFQTTPYWKTWYKTDEKNPNLLNPVYLTDPAGNKYYYKKDDAGGVTLTDINGNSYRYAKDSNGNPMVQTKDGITIELKEIEIKDKPPWYTKVIENLRWIPGIDMGADLVGAGIAGFSTYEGHWKVMGKHFSNFGVDLAINVATAVVAIVGQEEAVAPLQAAKFGTTAFFKTLMVKTFAETPLTIAKFSVKGGVNVAKTIFKASAKGIEKTYIKTFKKLGEKGVDTGIELAVKTEKEFVEKAPEMLKKVFTENAAKSTPLGTSELLDKALFNPKGMSNGKALDIAVVSEFNEAVEKEVGAEVYKGCTRNSEKAIANFVKPAGEVRTGLQKGAWDKAKEQALKDFPEIVDRTPENLIPAVTKYYKQFYKEAFEATWKDTLDNQSKVLWTFWATQPGALYPKAPKLLKLPALVIDYIYRSPFFVTKSALYGLNLPFGLDFNGLESLWFPDEKPEYIYPKLDKALEAFNTTYGTSIEFTKETKALIAIDLQKNGYAVQPTKDGEYYAWITVTKDASSGAYIPTIESLDEPAAYELKMGILDKVEAALEDYNTKNKSSIALKEYEKKMIMDVLYINQGSDVQLDVTTVDGIKLVFTMKGEEISIEPVKLTTKSTYTGETVTVEDVKAALDNFNSANGTSMAISDLASIPLSLNKGEPVTVYDTNKIKVTFSVDKATKEISVSAPVAASTTTTTTTTTGDTKTTTGTSGTTGSSGTTTKTTTGTTGSTSTATKTTTTSTGPTTTTKTKAEYTALEMVSGTQSGGTITIKKGDKVSWKIKSTSAAKSISAKLVQTGTSAYSGTQTFTNDGNGYFVCTIKTTKAGTFTYSVTGVGADKKTLYGTQTLVVN